MQYSGAPLGSPEALLTVHMKPKGAEGAIDVEDEDGEFENTLPAPK
jgi:hypothetical protein